MESNYVFITITLLLCTNAIFEQDCSGFNGKYAAFGFSSFPFLQNLPCEILKEGL